MCIFSDNFFKLFQGVPVLQEIEHDCNYKFEWATNILCPTHEIDFSIEKCEIFNKNTNVTLELRQITVDGKITVSLAIL